MKFALQIRAITLAAAACFSGFAQAESWSPHLEFQLGDSTYKETLIWISGVAYAWTAIWQEWEGVPIGESLGPCKFENAQIGSRELVEALNETHKGQTITPEQAMRTLYPKVLLSHLKCEKAPKLTH